MQTWLRTLFTKSFFFLPVLSTNKSDFFMCMYIFIYIYIYMYIITYIITYNVITYITTLYIPLVWQKKSLGIYFFYFQVPMQSLESTTFWDDWKLWTCVQPPSWTRCPSSMSSAIVRYTGAINSYEIADHTSSFHQNSRVMDKESNVFPQSWPHPAFLNHFLIIFLYFYIIIIMTIELSLI